MLRITYIARLRPWLRSGLVILGFLTISQYQDVVRATVVNTKHNLTAGRAESLTDSTAVCAYCHTPIGSDTSQPRWDRSGAENSNVFSTYDSFGRSNLGAGDAVGSVSFVCLSCHDGTQALDIESSMPGTATGIGGFLSQSHPVGIRYGAATVRSESGAYVEAPRGFAARSDPSQPNPGFRSADSAVIDDVTVWWVETGEPGRQRDDVHLYSRRETDGTDNAYVECASCHDPHTENPMFLRVVNQPGSVCSACHEV